MSRKFMEQKWSESEKWSRKTLDGKCDGYMWGLGGAENGKCWFLKAFFKGSRGARVSQEQIIAE